MRCVESGTQNCADVRVDIGGVLDERIRRPERFAFPPASAETIGHPRAFASSMAMLRPSYMLVLRKTSNAEQ